MGGAQTTAAGALPECLLAVGGAQTTAAGALPECLLAVGGAQTTAAGALPECLLAVDGAQTTEIHAEVAKRSIPVRTVTSMPSGLTFSSYSSLLINTIMALIRTSFLSFETAEL